MKSKIILSCCLSFALSIVSCKPELKPQDSASEVAQDTVTSIPNPEQVQTLQPTADGTMQSNAPVMQQTNMNPNQPTQTAPGMNPPHGEPGHICEIPVGAPLSSAKNKPASNVTTTSAPVNTPKPSTIQQVNLDGTKGAVQNIEMETPPGMNPPHGQPGHVCEVPVGSPLPK